MHAATPDQVVLKPGPTAATESTTLSVEDTDATGPLVTSSLASGARKHKPDPRKKKAARKRAQASRRVNRQRRR